MAEDSGDTGGGEGTEVARAYLSLAADLSPLMLAMGGLPALLKNPMTQAGTAGGNFLVDAFDRSLSHLMSANLGALLAEGGKAVTAGLASVVGGTFKMVLGDTLGGIVGWLPTHLISGVGGAVASLLGASLTAIISPVKAALAANLSDFGLWTNRAVEAEAATARFNATVANAGPTVGFTAEQLERMAEALSNTAGASSFSAREIRDTEGALLQFDRVRGQVFRRTMELAVQMASAKGMGVDEAARLLGGALSNPEQGAHRLRHASVFLGPQDLQDLKNVQDVNGTLAAQEKLLDLLKDKWAGAAAAMAGTTQGILGAVRTAWAGIGREIGEVFLPLTKVLSEGVLGVVRSPSGAASPVLKDMAATTGRWADSIRAFMAENEPTWRQWSDLVREITGNVYRLAQDAIAGLFAQMNVGGIRGFWETFSSGVTSALNWVGNLTSSMESFKAAANYALVYVRNRLYDFIDAAKSGDTWKSLWETLKTGFVSIVEWLRYTFGELADFLGNNLSIKTLEAIKDVMESVPGLGGSAKRLGEKIDDRKLLVSEQARARQSLGTEGDDRGKAIEDARALATKYMKEVADLEKKRDADSLSDEEAAHLAMLRKLVDLWVSTFDKLKAGVRPDAGPEPPAGGGADDPAKKRRDADEQEAKAAWGRQAQAAQVLRDVKAWARWGADIGLFGREMAKNADLLAAKGKDLDDAVQQNVRSFGIADFHKAIQESLHPPSKDELKAIAKKEQEDIAAMRKKAEEQVEQLKRVRDGVEKVVGAVKKIKFGFGP